MVKEKERKGKITNKFKYEIAQEMGINPTNKNNKKKIDNLEQKR